MTPAKRWATLAGAALGIGLVAGAAWPPPPIPKGQVTPATWNPPAASLARIPAKASEQAESLRWLGETDPEATVQDWRLAGILLSPEPVALVATGSTGKSGGKSKTVPRPARLTQGQTLPDGSRLVSIDSKSVTVELGNCQRIFQVHRPQPIRSSDGCAAGEADTDQRKSQ
jgi:hypothetical protein